MGADVKTKGNAGQCKVDMLQEGEVDLQIGIVWYTRTSDRAPLVPQAPFKPKKSLILVLGFMVGGMLGVMFVLVKNALRPPR